MKYESLRGRANWWRIHSAGAVHLWKHTPSKTEDNAGFSETTRPTPPGKKVCSCSNAQVTEPSICEAHGEFLRCPCGLEHVWEPE